MSTRQAGEGGQAKSADHGYDRARMPVRATKRGAERTPLSGDYDVVVCGASFAGLSVARELRGSGARVLVVDRYEIGERQTSACAAPTEWLANLGLEASIRQTFGDVVVHRPAKTYRWTLPWTFSTFDYPLLCELLAQQGDFTFETAKVDGITRAAGGTAHTVHTDRGDLRAPLVVDALGWRRVLSDAPEAIQPPDALLSRGLEVHPPIAGSDHATDLELWLDPKYVVPGYSWAFPAGDEVRVGVGSFDPRIHVKDPTVQLAQDIGVDTVGYQGNWIPHRLRPATADGVFFAGDSAGHCLPTTAEGIRTAFYFGLACGRELRRVIDGRQTRAQALARYHSFNEDHRYAFDWLWRVQRIVSKINKLPAMDTTLDLTSHPRMIRWAFTHYLNIAPPSFALDDARPWAVEPWSEPAAQQIAA
jgi:flavin-dependent dehydrogenase